MGSDIGKWLGPHFIIIGAMKSGTTTLYQVLRDTPGIWLPNTKEPKQLLKAKSRYDRYFLEYARLFRAAPENAIVGEASTWYTKAPIVDGIPEHLFQLFGGKRIKFIYIMRDPVARAVSHYHHARAQNSERRGIEEVFSVNDSPYVYFSRYDYQLRNYLEVFPRSRMLLLRYEDFLDEPAVIINKILNFVGAPEAELGRLTQLAQSNRTAGKSDVGGRFRFILESNMYREKIRPHLSNQFVDSFKRLVSRPYEGYTNVGQHLDTKIRAAIGDGPYELEGKEFSEVKWTRG